MTRCENCNHSEAKEIWFDNGKEVYRKYLCEECVNKFKQDCKNLAEYINEILNKEEKPFFLFKIIKRLKNWIKKLIAKANL